MLKPEIIKIEKVAVGGEGIGHIGAREVRLWDAFEGEEVMPLIFAKRKTVHWGRADEVSLPSPDRIPHKEKHFLSCSPWSGVSFEYEQKLKTKIIADIFADFNLGEIEIVSDGVIEGYRNKMEYSFGLNQGGELSLSFIERMGRKRIALESCILADLKITEHSKEILQRLKKYKVSTDALKALIIRSDSSGAVGSALFVVDKNLQWPEIVANLNCVVYYSNPQSPMSIATEYICGDEKIEFSENINDVQIKYGILGFFQVNIPLFKKVIKVMEGFVEGENIVDMFCGVGAISLALSENIKNADLIDIDANNIKMAFKNIENNNLQQRFSAACLPAEKATEAISKDKILILDPNRPGLHKDIIAKIRETQPKRIVYLSCNIETQARDIKLISDLYQPAHASFYNFFPRTPHIESLFVLDLI